MGPVRLLLSLSTEIPPLPININRKRTNTAINKQPAHARTHARTWDVLDDGAAEVLEVGAVEGRAELCEHVEHAARGPHVHALFLFLNVL
jgi:hypothetical protein